MDGAGLIMLCGLLVGVLYGLFGVGSAFATPMLSLIGVSGMAAVVGPLPALLPGSAAGAWSYSRRGKVCGPVARRTLAGALPAAIAGAAVSGLVGGPILLALSGVVLFGVGLRVLRPIGPRSVERATSRRANAGFVIGSAAVVGFVAGLLANGGGFLLVPLFLLALGLDMNEAAGTSLVVAAALSVPTIATHALLGDVDWVIAAWFAVGLVPGVLVGSAGAQRLPTHRLRVAFGAFLVVFAVWYLARQLPILFS
jgi:uncharacterized membrane protein YfcA